jgi:hypothetical protein
VSIENILSQPGGPTRKRFSWRWLLIALVVVGVAGFFALRGGVVGGTAEIPDPEVIDDSGSYSGDTFTAVGAVKNKGNGATKDLQVKVTVLDGSTPIGSGQQELGALEPGAQRVYSIVIKLSSSPDHVDTLTTWTWTADQCPPGSSPTPDPSDTSVQLCGGGGSPTSSPS